jgi:hypothetical protein
MAFLAVSRIVFDMLDIRDTPVCAETCAGLISASQTRDWPTQACLVMGVKALLEQPCAH